MKTRLTQGLDPQLYFYRDHQGHEVDLIYKTGNQLIPIEVKAGKTFNKEFLKHLRYFSALVGDRCPTGFVIYAGEKEARIDNFHLLNYSRASAIFQML